MVNTRRKGMRFEAKVREYLENRGWIVTKWQNNVDLSSNKMVPARQGKFRLTSTGFPDFICFRKRAKGRTATRRKLWLYEIMGLECKVNGYLSQTEREKCDWLIRNDVLPNIYIASKDGREIKLEEYDE